MIPGFTVEVSGDGTPCFFLLLKQQGLLPIRPFVHGICELIKVQTKCYLFISSTHKRHIKQAVKIKKDPYDLIYTLIFS